MSDQQNEIVENYIKSFSALELITYNIALKQLKSSFDIEKSIGFKEWKKNNSNK